MPIQTLAEARAQLATEPDIKVLTFRTYYNAFPDRFTGNDDVLHPTLHPSSSSSRSSPFSPSSSSSSPASSRSTPHALAISSMPSTRERAAHLIERHFKPTTLLYSIKQFVYSVLIVHYLLYWIAFAALLIALYLAGLGWLALLATAAYLPSYVEPSQLRLGRAWDAYRQNNFWSYSHFYCRLEAVRLAKLDPAKRYIFAVHPHGILIISRIGLYGGTFERLFPGLDTRTLGASPMFYVPFAREICLWMGAVDAGKKTAQLVLRSNSPAQTSDSAPVSWFSFFTSLIPWLASRSSSAPASSSSSSPPIPLSLFVYPGGSKEIFGTNPMSKKTIVIARRGFIRLAIENGCDIVPVFVFGEKWMYKVKQPSRSVVDFFLSIWKTPVLFFHGRYGTWLPFFSTMSIVFDQPIVIESYQRRSACRQTEGTPRSKSESVSRRRVSTLKEQQPARSKLGASKAVAGEEQKEFRESRTGDPIKEDLNAGKQSEAAVEDADALDHAEWIDQEVERVYEEYYRRIRGLWDKYKTVYGYEEDEELEIIHDEKGGSGATPQKRKPASSSPSSL